MTLCGDLIILWLITTSIVHIAHINDQRLQVLVVHGGLFDRDDVTLDELRAIDRHCEPPVEGLMCDLLWADPKVRLGLGSFDASAFCNA